MTGELLHLSNHETLRVLREVSDELEVEATWTPGGSAPPEHLHPDQEERFEVRTGRLTAVVDGVERQLGPGDNLEIPPRTPHKMWNAGDETASAMWRTRPAGRTASWFRRVDRLTAGGTRKPATTGLAKALTEYSDVFQLVVRPKPLRPLVSLAIRVLAIAGR